MPQQFVVPQFTDEEDKIFGPIVIRQFIIVVVLVFTEYLLYKLLAPIAFYIISVPVVGFGLGLAFLKVNGFPMHLFLLNMAIYFRRPRFRVWHLEEGMADNKSLAKIKRGTAPVTKEVSRLSELSLIVDTGGAFAGFDEEDNFKNIISGFQER